MEQQQFPPRKSPRRRRTRRSVKSPAGRTYASENDMPTEPLFPIELAEPVTPQKSASDSPSPPLQPIENKPRRRNGTKSRPKHATPPEAADAKKGRVTPPQPAAPKPIHAPVFAGATFHASPAPSSLPIPSFLSKALDSPSVQDSDRLSREPSPPATDSETPTPKHRVVVQDVAARESPLDIFFRADRAEKDRARRASSANILARNLSPFSPPIQIQPSREPQTLPHVLFGARNHPPGLPRSGSVGIPASELDGTPGRPVGPAFSTPYHDRIRAARPTEKQAESEQKSAPSPGQQPMAYLSENLKPCPPLPSVLAGHGAPQLAAVFPGSTNKSPISAGPGPISVSPASPASAMRSPDDGRSAEIQHLEDSLRRVLKLDPGLRKLNLAASRPPTNYESF